MLLVQSARPPSLHCAHTVWEVSNSRLHVETALHKGRQKGAYSSLEGFNCRLFLFPARAMAAFVHWALAFVAAFSTAEEWQ